MRPFRWLHISDLFVRQMQPRWSAPIRCICEQATPFANLDAIFVTGNVTAGGKPDEYDEASEILKKMAALAGLTHDRVYVVPGDHDVDRSAIRPRHQFTVADDVNDIEALFGDSIVRRLLEEKFAGFHKLADNKFSSWHGGRHPLTAQSIDHGDAAEAAQLGIIGLNTAWLSGGPEHSESEKGRLLVGQSFVATALEDLAAKTDAVFVLMHHPIGWLRAIERDSMAAAIKKAGAVVLTGHRSNGIAADWRAVSPPRQEGSAVYASAGHLYDTEALGQWVNVGQWDIETGGVSIDPWAFNGSTQCFERVETTGEALRIDQPRKVGRNRSATKLTLGHAGPPIMSLWSESWNAVVVYLDGPANMRKLVHTVVYTCGGREYAHNANDKHRFPSAIVVEPNATITATVTFRDGAKQPLSAIKVHPKA